MSDHHVRLQSLHVYPIKSCAGAALDESLLVETGFEFDRAWMVVDETGALLTQRTLPRMQLVEPTLRSLEMKLKAPGMLALHLPLDAVEAPCRVRVWSHEMAAFDMGALAAQWFSDFLGRPARLVRFDPTGHRPADPGWTAGLDVPVSFVDDFPLLVISQASLDGLNLRLAERGHAPASMARFRPNLVLAGVDDAHAEDFIDEVVFEAAGVTIKLLKPCVRCSVPDVDPLTAKPGQAVSEELASYRSDPRMAGGITFGMNAVIMQGVDRTLRAGAHGSACIRF